MAKPGGRPIRKRVEARYLRSNGKPSFSNRVYAREQELEYIMRKYIARATPTEPVGEVIKHMTNPYCRRLPICRATGEIEGVITSSDIVSYFGGGDYYKIVVNRHKRNIYLALQEPISTIMSKDVIFSSVKENLCNVLEKMIIHGVGIVPIVDDDLKLVGVISERDILEHLSEKSVGVKVEEVMSRGVISVNINSTIMEASKSMIKYGYRRLPVVEGEYVLGIITTLNIIDYFASNKVFNYTPTGDINDALKVPIREIYDKRIITISPNVDVGEAVNTMVKEKVDALIVTCNDRMVGIITERDALLSLALKG